MATVTKHVDPISRIEGHLGVKLTVDDVAGKVTGADVHGNLWRGFENFLVGREPNDAITFVQRICGVCPVPHGMTSTFAVESVVGYNDCFHTYVTAGAKGVPAKALHIRNLVLGAEFLMSHITHFYHLAAPSYVQGPPIPPWTPYFNEALYDPALRSSGNMAASGLPSTSGGFSDNLWSAVITSYVKALRIRRLTFEAGALFAGRMPMTSCFVAGGVTVPKEESLTARIGIFEDMLAEITDFIAKEYVPIALALGALSTYAAFDNQYNGGQDVGGGVGRFLSWGAFPQADNSLYLKGGTVIVNGYTAKCISGVDNTAVTVDRDNWMTGKADAVAAKALVMANLKESVAHSRYVADTAQGFDATTLAAYPGDVGRTEPVRDEEEKYSWIKGPRWDGQSMEVGPFARLVVNDLYPVDGTMFAAHANLGPIYVTYTKAFTAGGAAAGGVEFPAGTYRGLDASKIGTDIAVALVRGGLADVYYADGTQPADEAEIVANYGSLIVTGPVATAIITMKGGLSTLDRLRARAFEALLIAGQMVTWLNALKALPAGSPSYAHIATPTTVKSGFGATEAPRGALAHFITINGGRIQKYQCVVPTTWNASPKDSLGNTGPMEQAMIGSPYSTLKSEFTPMNPGAFGAKVVSGKVQCESGVEALRIAQSFDPCIACAVH